MVLRVQVAYCADCGMALPLMAEGRCVACWQKRTVDAGEKRAADQEDDDLEALQAENARLRRRLAASEG